MTVVALCSQICSHLITTFINHIDLKKPHMNTSHTLGGLQLKGRRSMAFSAALYSASGVTDSLSCSDANVTFAIGVFPQPPSNRLAATTSYSVTGRSL